SAVASAVHLPAGPGQRPGTGAGLRTGASRSSHPTAACYPRPWPAATAWPPAIRRAASRTSRALLPDPADAADHCPFGAGDQATAIALRHLAVELQVHLVDPDRPVSQLHLRIAPGRELQQRYADQVRVCRQWTLLDEAVAVLRERHRLAIHARNPRRNLNLALGQRRLLRRAGGWAARVGQCVHCRHYREHHDHLRPRPHLLPPPGLPRTPSRDAKARTA